MKWKVYTDGSFNSKAQTVGWAYILVNEHGRICHEEQGYSIDPKIVSMHNYSGELLAAWYAITDIIGNRVSYKDTTEVTIYHDYEGVGAWPTGKYKKPGNDFSKWYRDQMIAAGEMIDIDYVWVKGHSGNEYNERVDKMAKKACGLL